MSYNFKLPGNTVVGGNALEACEKKIKSYGKKAFVITGKIVIKTDAFEILKNLLIKWGIDFFIYNEIIGEPTDKMIKEGVNLYKQENCDFLIAMGGGSPLDSAKAIAAMSTLKGEVSDYMGVEIEGSFPPMVLIPTTAGTGSEATKFTVITDSQKDIKMLLKGDALLPDLAVIDPKFTLSAPKGITAATGMDALTHAVEAYTSKKACALTDIFAIDAIKRIFTYLPKAYDNGQDYKAREEMSIAAYEAGVCINNSSVTIVHGMSRPIGALFHVPHGISNAMLIKECLEYVQDGCYKRFADIARAIGAAANDDDDREASAKFIDELKNLCAKLEIPTLAEYGIKREEFEKVKEKMAQDAIASGSPSNTIKNVAKEDLIAIYNKLW